MTNTPEIIPYILYASKRMAQEVYDFYDFIAQALEDALHESRTTHNFKTAKNIIARALHQAGPGFIKQSSRSLAQHVLASTNLGDLMHYMGRMLNNVLTTKKQLIRTRSSERPAPRVPARETPSYRIEISSPQQASPSYRIPVGATPEAGPSEAELEYKTREQPTLRHRIPQIPVGPEIPAIPAPVTSAVGAVFPRLRETGVQTIESNLRQIRRHGMSLQRAAGLTAGVGMATAAAVQAGYLDPVINYFRQHPEVAQEVTAAVQAQAPQTSSPNPSLEPGVSPQIILRQEHLHRHRKPNLAYVGNYQFPATGAYNYSTYDKYTRNNTLYSLQ